MKAIVVFALAHSHYVVLPVEQSRPRAEEPMKRSVCSCISREGCWMCFCLVFPDAPWVISSIKAHLNGILCMFLQRAIKTFCLITLWWCPQNRACKETQHGCHAYTFDHSADTVRAERGRTDLLHKATKTTRDLLESYALERNGSM